MSEITCRSFLQKIWDRNLFWLTWTWLSKMCTVIHQLVNKITTPHLNKLWRVTGSQLEHHLWITIHFRWIAWAMLHFPKCKLFNNTPIKISNLSQNWKMRMKTTIVMTMSIIAGLESMRSAGTMTNTRTSIRTFRSSKTQNRPQLLISRKLINIIWYHLPWVWFLTRVTIESSILNPSKSVTNTLMHSQKDSNIVRHRALI